MITIKADQYVKNEGDSGKTDFTFTVAATDLFVIGAKSNGNQAKLGIRVLTGGMDSIDGVKLKADTKNGVTALDADSGFITFDAKADKFTEVKVPEMIGGVKVDETVHRTYTKTITVEASGDTRVEAHEMFAVAITTGFMMRDDKLLMDSEEEEANADYPHGTFDVKQTALQVVRNDDGITRTDGSGVKKLAAEVKKITGFSDHVEYAGERLPIDAKGTGSKSEPKPWSKMTPNEAKKAHREMIEKLGEDLKRAEKAGDAKAAAAVRKKAKAELERYEKQLKSFKKPAATGAGMFLAWVRHVLMSIMGLIRKSVSAMFSSRPSRETSAG